MEVTEVREFIRSCIELPGGVVEPHGPHVLEALLPPPLEPLAGGNPIVSLALDTEGLAADPAAEPATVGSPFLDGLIRYASEHGTASSAHVIVDHPRRKGLQDEVARHLLFHRGRVRFEDRDPDIFNDASVQFTFRVTFLSEERRERLYVLPVSLRTKRLSRELAERLPALAISDARAPFSDAPRGSIEDAYAVARDALHRQVADEVERHQARIRKRFTVESGRVSDYYVALVRDLERRQEREADAAKRAAVAQKIDAARRERERKLRELGDTYQLRLRARLASARLLSQPKTFFKLFIDRGSTTRELALVYDSVLDRLEPPFCDACGQEMTHIDITASGQLLCPACATKP